MTDIDKAAHSGADRIMPPRNSPEWEWRFRRVWALAEAWRVKFRKGVVGEGEV